VPRLGVGIGSAPVEGATDYVLGRFFEEEQPLLDATIRRAADAVKWAIDKGLIAAMNLFNQQPEEK
jgi:PTH1 family peptidyl-tRNA hydrolase